MGVDKELKEGLVGADVEAGRARAVSDITIPGQVDPDKVRRYAPPRALSAQRRAPVDR